MHLGLFVQAAGHHVAGWRMPGAQAGGENLPLLLEIARLAEDAKFDMLFLADAPFTRADFHPATIVRFEPLTLLTALSMVTTHIGLVGTASTTYTEPFNLARQFGTLDHISGGRSGWNIVTGAQPGAAANFGNTPHPPHDERYAIAIEYVKVAKGLWDSWEDGAIVKDVASGKYIDTTKMHALNHKGEHFSVSGPMNLSRPPQGYPIMVQAGASDAGRAFASSVAEVIYSVQQDLEAAKSFAQDIRRGAEKIGRNPRHVKIMPGVCPIVGTSYKDAKAKLTSLCSMMDPKAALRILSDRLGHDLSSYPLDGPVPDLPPSGIMQAHAVTLKKLARDQTMNLRDLRDYAASAQGHRLLLGSAEDIADGLEEWFAADAADGFNIMPPWFPDAFRDFTEQVVPVLQKRGLFRTEYSGRMLRDHLGLPRPPHPVEAKKAASYPAAS